MITLYDYFRSSACYRVRIALALKGLKYNAVNVDLLKNEHNGDAFHAVNPQQTLPYFKDGKVEMGQSLAIVEYLDETHPEPKLVRGSPEDRAYIRQLSLLVACEMHAPSQPQVWKTYLPQKLGASETQGKDWLNYWLSKGFGAYEDLLKKYGRSGTCSFGDAPSMADLCLIPQLYNARRNGFDLKDYPAVLKIERHCINLKAFQDAAPEHHAHAPAGLEQIHGVHSPLAA